MPSDFSHYATELGAFALLSFVVHIVFNTLIPKLLNDFKEESRIEREHNMLISKMEREAHLEAIDRITATYEKNMGEVTGLLHELYMKGKV